MCAKRFPLVDKNSTCNQRQYRAVVEYINTHIPGDNYQEKTLKLTQLYHRTHGRRVAELLALELSDFISGGERT